MPNGRTYSKSDGSVLYKSLGGKVKDATKSPDDMEFIIGRENVVDLEHDMFMPGSMESKDYTLQSPWGHQLRSEPVAAGKIYRGDTDSNEGTEILYKPKWFETDSAKQNKILFEDEEFRKTVEFSFAFRPLEATVVRDRNYGLNYYKAFVFEVSPQYIGASIETGVKAFKDMLLKAEDEESPIEEKVQQANSKLFVAKLKMAAARGVLKNE